MYSYRDYLPVVDGKLIYAVPIYATQRIIVNKFNRTRNFVRICGVVFTSVRTHAVVGGDWAVNVILFGV